MVGPDGGITASCLSNIMTTSVPLPPGAMRAGSQVAEWKHVRWDPDTGVVHSWWWEGVTKLDARWKMDATIAFDEVEVFN